MPDLALQRIIQSNPGADVTLKAAVKPSKGNNLLVYYPENNTAKIKNILTKPATATWFDPCSAQEIDAGRFAAGGIRSQTPPAGWEDAVLILSAVP